MSIADPLQQPKRDAPVLGRFLSHFALDREQDSGELLGRVASAFARLPYENLTKIVKHAEIGSDSAARRLPGEVVADHVALGAGGTCFALTAALLHLVRALGWHAEPILADRRYGADTHSAILVWQNGRPLLLDPGFLIVRPMPLPTDGSVTIATPFNQLVLEAKGGDKLDLCTLQQGQKTYRLTFKTSPADPGAFLHAWDASFDWDMMRYPLLTRIVADRQLYLQDTHYQSRSHDTVAREELDRDRLIERIARDFRIDPALIARALRILARQGEIHGRAPTP